MSPDKRLCPYRLAGRVDRCWDVGFELGDAAVGGAAELAVGQLGESAFHEIDPRRDGRREVQVEARMAQQPFLHRLGLVRGVVVADQVQL